MEIQQNLQKHCQNKTKKLRINLTILDFEHFYDQESEEDRLDTIALLDEVSKEPPPPPIKEQTKELKEQQLNEDKEDDFMGVKTKSQHNKILEKKLRFDLNQTTETT